MAKTGEPDSGGHPERPAEGIVELCYSDDPSDALRGVRIMRTTVDRMEFEVVRRARSGGWSWNDIAEALGKGKQNVWRKHHLLDDESIDLEELTPS